MKQYSPPKIEHKPFQGKEPLASLNQWLEKNHLQEAGIVTYKIYS